MAFRAQQALLDKALSIFLQEERLSRMAQDQSAGASTSIYHIRLNSDAMAPLFSDNEDRLKLLEILTSSVIKEDFDLLGYCLLVENVHLVVRIDDVRLASFMQQLTTRFADYMVGKYGHYHSPFSGSFRVRRLDEESYLPDLLVHLHRQPVQLGLSDNADQWPWSFVGEIE